MKTQKQIDADAQLEEAIKNCATVYGLTDPDCGEPQMLGDYCCVIEGLQFGSTGDLESDFYYLLLPNGNLPTAKAKGLLYQGLHLLDFGHRLPNDE